MTTETARAAHTARSLRLGVVQLALEDELAANRDKIMRFIHEAAAGGCRVVVFPEGALSSPAGTTAADIEAAADALCGAARDAGIYVVTGLQHKRADDAPPHQRLLAIGPNGRVLQTYDKIWGDPLANDVPGPFKIDGVTCGAVICADRWARGIAELPAFDGAQLLIECSCNWLREWTPDLDHFWCAPRARRTGAYVVFSNTTRISGGRPGHGHSAIFAPDGSRLVHAGDDPDRLLVATLDLSLATRHAAAERRSHPLFGPFWDVGVALMKGRRTDVLRQVLDDTSPPLRSPEVALKVAAAQMACSRSLEQNVRHAVALIHQAASERADVVVFPELALTGAFAEDIEAANAVALNAALTSIQQAARAAGMYVVIGLPWIEHGRRLNCAAAIGPDGSLLTRYAQLAVDVREEQPPLFAAGTSTRAMWFAIKGVPTVMTVGRDALWSELAELAAVRGAQVHLHLAYDRDTTPGASRRRRQLWANLASFRTLTVTVNAADARDLPEPSAPAQGGSVIWEDFRREPHATARRAGHGPWSAYRLEEAAEGEELLSATQTVLATNAHFKETVERHNPQMRPWYALGARVISADLAQTVETEVETEEETRTAVLADA
ncbi:MAG: carbon-nitrogen hydrolase family protein [Chloroflexota bacterium]